MLSSAKSKQVKNKKTLRLWALLRRERKKRVLQQEPVPSRTLEKKTKRSKICLPKLTPRTRNMKSKLKSS